jgi:hypothetical protein
MIIDIMDELMPNAIIIVENNRGRELINLLMETKYRTQVWYDRDKLFDVPTETKNMYGIAETEARTRRAYGVYTSPKTRERIMEVLRNFMAEKIEKIYTKYLVQDIMNLKLYPNGKVAASEGNHDDNVMACFIGFTILVFDDLSQWGFVRGATAPHDPNKPLSFNQTKNALASLISKLPENAQAMFGSVLAQMNNQTEGGHYKDPLDRLMEEQMQQQSLQSQLSDNSRFLSESDVAKRQAARFNNILDSNFINEAAHQVNIEDWI